MEEQKILLAEKITAASRFLHFPVLLCTLLVWLLAETAASAEAGWYVSDFAGLLDESDADELEDRLAAISEEYGCDLAVVTVDDCGGQDIQSYTDDFYEYNGFGQGADNSGMMLLVDMESRQFHMSTFGTAIEVFTDYGMQVIDDEITDYLHDGDYAEAFDIFADMGEEFLQEAQNGTPFDTNHPWKKQMALWLRLLISAGSGLLAAAVVAGVLFAQLKSTGHERRAALYAREGSFRVTRARDIFLYRTRTRRKIERDRRHGGGGGSHTHSTSGGSRAGGHTGSF